MRCRDLILLCIHLGAVLTPRAQRPASLPRPPLHLWLPLTLQSFFALSCQHLSSQGFPTSLSPAVADGSWLLVTKRLKLKAVLSLKCRFPKSSGELWKGTPALRCRLRRGKQRCSPRRPPGRARWGPVPLHRRLLRLFQLLSIIFLYEF